MDEILEAFQWFLNASEYEVRMYLENRHRKILSERTGFDIAFDALIAMAED